MSTRSIRTDLQLFLRLRGSRRLVRRRCLAGAALVSATALLLACGGASGGVTEVVARQGAELHQAESCDDLLSEIQSDAIAKLDLQVEQYKQNGAGYGGRGIAVDDGLGQPSGTGGTTSAGNGAGEGASGPILPGASGGEAEGPDGHSETNTQVAGVDEADIVKTDGERIYLVHGTELYLLDSWPADETRVMGSATVEGTPFELFASEGKAVVFSTVWREDATSGGGIAEPAPDCFDCYYGYGAQYTKVSVFDVSGEAPVLGRELLFEGGYVSARRHGDVVRTIIQGGFKAPELFYPNVQTQDAFGNPYGAEVIAAQLDQWRERVANDIRATTLDDWLPRRFEKEGDEWKPLPAECGSYFVPAPGSTDYGVTQVVSFDAEGSSAPHVASVLGGSSTVYANQDVLILGQTDYGWAYGFGEATRTDLHLFDIADDATPYRASGYVPGYLHNQFSLDEKDGVIRVSTTEERRTDPKEPWITTTSNRVYTLGVVEDALGVLGRTEALADGETIYATRFIGDRGYLVTFRQIDPLFVIDLADPAKPQVLGELEMPGFSEYLHPLDETHLLTIGQGGTAEGQTTGATLRIFDVSDPTAPELTFDYALGENAYSEANNNHKAFTFVPDKGLLMFPLVSYSPTYVSALEVFHVDAESGFERIGAIDHTALINHGCAYDPAVGPCYYYYGEEMRRGLLIDDFVYAVSQGGVTVHTLDSLAEVGRVELPPPGYKEVGVGGTASGGSAGASSTGGTTGEPMPVGMGGAAAE